MMQRNKSEYGKEIEIAEAEQKKRMKRNEDSLSGLWENIHIVRIQENIHTVRIQENTKRKGQRTHLKT